MTLHMLNKFHERLKQNPKEAFPLSEKQNKTKQNNKNWFCA